MMESIKSLATSRKFWLSVISAVSAIAMYRSHTIDGGQLATALQVAGGVLVASIAIEDHGTNSAPQVVTGGPTIVSADATQPVAVPSIPPVTK